MKQLLIIGLLTITSLAAMAEEQQAQTLVGKFARVSCVPAEAKLPDTLVISKWPTTKGLDFRIIDPLKPEGLFESFYSETSKKVKTDMGAAAGSIGLVTSTNDVTETSAIKRDSAIGFGFGGPMSSRYGSEYTLDHNNKDLLVIKKYNVGHSFFPDMPHEELECLYARQAD